MNTENEGGGKVTQAIPPLTCSERGKSVRVTRGELRNVEGEEGRGGCEIYIYLKF